VEAFLLHATYNNTNTNKTSQEESQLPSLSCEVNNSNRYDAICLSRLLSLVSSPARRLLCVQRARLLLQEPYAAYTGLPHRSGVLLLVEREGVFEGKQDQDQGRQQRRRPPLPLYKNDRG
jgi:hypothetical protein